MNDTDRGGAPAAPAPDAEATQASLLTGQLAREIGAPLASALERVITLTETGKIRRAGLVALREEIEQAMQAAEAAQQLCSLMRLEVRVRKQPVDLAKALEAALAPQGQPHPETELHVRGPGLVSPVQTDPLMLERLLGALSGWAQRRAEGRVHWALEPGKLNAEARVTCALRLRNPAADGMDGRPAAMIDWRLVESLASVLGLRLACRLDGPMATLAVEFPRAKVEQSIEGMVVEELDPEDALALYATTVAGTSVLIVAGRRETRELVEAAIKPLGLLSDFARSVDEARTFCKNGMPHAVVYEPTVRGASFEPLRVELLAEAPSMVLVEIVDEDSPRQENTAATAAPRPRARRDSLARDLPGLLMSQLTRSLSA